MHSKRAMLFVGSMLVLGNHTSARMSQCTAIMKKIIRFSENGMCNLYLDCEITAGDMKVEILNSKKEQILMLDVNRRTGSFPVYKGERYAMVIRTAKMSGRYTINWN